MVEPDLDAKVDQAIKKTQKFLLDLQKPDGNWLGELVVDTTLVSDYMLYMYWMGEVNVEKQAKCVKHILDRQLPDGGWNIYTGGPSEVNASVKCYLSLKLAGYTQDDPVMKKARHTILRLGGIPKMNTYGKLYLALIGQYPWKYLPIIPVETILLPNWLYFNIYEMSSWTRAMFVPLSIINHFKPTKHLPPEKQLHELYPYGTEGMDYSPEWDKGIPGCISWKNFFLAWDAFLKFVDKLPWKPFRGMALRKAEEWIVERIGKGSDGLGAIFPSMLNTLLTLKCLGYSSDNPLFKKNERHFLDFQHFDEENDDFRIQPCFSPVWDTAISLVALGSSGVDSKNPQVRKAADWLLDREVRVRGDWAVKNPSPEAGGWAFEFNNDYYPDVDDTFKVLLGLRLADATDKARQEEVMDRALAWAKSFQCKDGGYAAFDKDVTKKWLEHVPFADHNAILDPSCSDITARFLECVGKLKKADRKDPYVLRAVRYLKKTQEEDGSWFGRWGVNYTYGTWQALRGMHAIGWDMNEDWLVRARDWLESCQNPDGGWGESCASYEDPRLKGQGPSTPSQTAWALMGLQTGGDSNRPSILKAVNYLTTTQLDNGNWREDYITGTGFPCVFYLKYDLYRTNWPLIALSEYRELVQKNEAALD